MLEVRKAVAARQHDAPVIDDRDRESRDLLPLHLRAHELLGARQARRIDRGRRLVGGRCSTGSGHDREQCQRGRQRRVRGIVPGVMACLPAWPAAR